jgi:hypothetical protein
VMKNLQSPKIEGTKLPKMLGTNIREVKQNE